MRTTINLDEDVAARLRDLARRQGRSVSRVTNEVLRIGFQMVDSAVATPSTYEPRVLDSGRPLVDVTDVAAALERLEGRDGGG